jgi:hypothetical protein
MSKFFDSRSAAVIMSSPFDPGIAGAIDIVKEIERRSNKERNL